MDIPNRIKSLRVEKGYTQVQIAKIIGVSRLIYIDIEKGRHKIDAVVLCKLADIYKVSVDYILCRTEVEKPEYITNGVVGKIINEAQTNVHIMSMFKILENASDEVIAKGVQIFRILEE